MPRYRDDWLIDRVMFDYLSGGSCACCGMSHANLFLPNGTADLVAAVSDLETDRAAAEVEALASPKNPWPRDLRDQVWADRVRVRQHMKRDMAKYRTFWAEHGEACRAWVKKGAEAMERGHSCGGASKTAKDGDPGAAMRRIFQVSRSEISLVLSERYNIHSAYGVVLCAALEQIAFFDLTGYGPDGPSGSAEAEFDSVLAFDRRRGFTLKGLGLPFEPADGMDDATTNGSGRSDSNAHATMEIWLRRLQSLGGPKLLEKPLRQRTRMNNDEDEDDFRDGGSGDADSAQTFPVPSSSSSSEPSFQSDRRVLRLVIARYFADQLMKKYEESKDSFLT
jgi:hypothetical protein